MAYSGNSHERSAVPPYELPAVSYYPDNGREMAKKGLNGYSDEMESPEKGALLPVGETSTVRIIQTGPEDYEVARKTISAEKVDLSSPPDRFRLVFIIMLVHGMGVLLPWNVFINADAYFTQYKLMPSCPPLNQSECNVTNNQLYNQKWTNDMTMAAQMPNLILNAVNLFIHLGGSLTKRIAVSIVILILVLLETCTLTLIETWQWTGIFFGISIASVVILNMAGGIYQNSLYGLGASFPGRYTNAIITGNNICGTFIAILNILSMSVFPISKELGHTDPNHGYRAFTYFLIALLFMLFVFGTYFVLPFLDYYRHFLNRMERAVATAGQGKDTFLDHVSSLWITFQQVWVQCWNVFFVFFVTLACFPVFGIFTKPMNEEYNVFDTYFHAIGLFLNFNLFAFVGNLLPNLFVWPGPRWVWIPVLARVLFIPFFIACNMRNGDGSRGYGVLFESDWYFFAGQMLLGLTSGYFSSLCMMYAPGQVKDKALAPKAGQIAAFFLVTGIFVGLLFPRLVINKL